MLNIYVDSNGHKIIWSFDPQKGNVWTKPRYFGEFLHEDGTIACDGDFKEEKTCQ
jgi:hypothetical protein